MTEDQQLDLWLGATRYYLGRMSASVDSFCTLLIQEWDTLPMSVRGLIRRDVEEAFARDDSQRYAATLSGPYPLGHDCDRDSWTRVRHLWATASPTMRLILATRHRAWRIRFRDVARWLGILWLGILHGGLLYLLVSLE